MNLPAMPGRVMTWRQWLDEYDPVELYAAFGMTQQQHDILHWLNHQTDQHGTAIGNEWRADNGRWSMRGKAVERAKD